MHKGSQQSALAGSGKGSVTFSKASCCFSGLLKEETQSVHPQLATLPLFQAATDRVTLCVPWETESTMQILSGRSQEGKQTKSQVLKERVTTAMQIRVTRTSCSLEDLSTEFSLHKTPALQPFYCPEWFWLPLEGVQKINFTLALYPTIRVGLKVHAADATAAALV